MSQNGPYPGPPSHPWSSRNDEPYTEPADPWGEQNHVADWSGQPGSQPHGPESSLRYAPSYSLAPPLWAAPPAPPRRRNTAIVALVIVLAVAIVGGVGTTAWLLNRGARPVDSPGVVPSAATPTTAANMANPQPSEDARFVKKGQCVRNQGTVDTPAMTIVPCGTGTYEVLKRIDGRTTGQVDAETKCSKVPSYTKWYFYDSELDSLDFVLCLKER
jgi:hypothetical protein